MLVIAFPGNFYAQPLAERNSVPHVPVVHMLEAKLNVPSTPPALPTPKAEKFVPFRVGEKFKYSVGWGKILRAGTVTVEVEDIIDYQGYDVYRILVTARSSKGFSLFFRVRDELESLIDVDGLFSRRYWTKQEEGRLKFERKYEADQENNVLYQDDKEYYIRYGIQDEVSAVFYVRTLDLQVGNPVYVDIFARGKNWRVKCAVTQTETIKVPAGEFETILVEPELHFDGVMKKGKSKSGFQMINDVSRFRYEAKSRSDRFWFDWKNTR